MLYEDPPKKSDKPEMEFTSDILAIIDEDLLDLSKAAEGLANSIQEALGDKARQGEIAVVVAGNQELVNSCVDAYVDSLECMQKLMIEEYAPATPKLTRLEAELELARQTQKTCWKKPEIT